MPNLNHFLFPPQIAYPLNFPTQRVLCPIMSELGENGGLEMDCSMDFSRLNNRVESFQGSTLAQKVPPERLARAGFYFTGTADRVQCFSCSQTVDNWHSGDTPVQRHKEVVIYWFKWKIYLFVVVIIALIIRFLLLQVSPSCRFLMCTHRTGLKPAYGTPLIDTSTYDEVAEDMQYRLSTGEVVDQTPYPKVPHMRSEQARLQTFSLWPLSAPVRARDLAQAGFYYSGQSDRVQCFCCGGKLSDWENGDDPWNEHSRHYPNCFFILGHDVGNVPLLDNGDRPTEEVVSARNVNVERDMETFEGRLSSFAGVQHPVNHERLARAGFYSTGRAQLQNKREQSEGMIPYSFNIKGFELCLFRARRQGVMLPVWWRLKRLGAWGRPLGGTC